MISLAGCIDALLRRWLRLPVAVRASLPVAIMVLLWWSSSQQPTSRAPSVVRALLHNGMHVLAYGALGGSSWLALSRRRTVPSSRAAAVASLAIAIGYGVVDELHQSFVDGRVCSVADLMTDAAGASLALMWLRARLGVVPLSWRRLLVTVLVCLACVVFATFGPL